MWFMFVFVVKIVSVCVSVCWLVLAVDIAMTFGCLVHFHGVL